MEVEMPFICTFCGGAFCANHRLPENHECSEYWKVRMHGQQTVTWTTPSDIRAYAGTYASSPRLRFSHTELKHIAIGITLVSAVGLSFFGPQAFLDLMAIAAAVLFFTSGFIIHEIAHKATAQHYGLWAEFRLDRFGAILTLLSAVSPFKIIAPGAVVIAGNTSQDRVGRTAVAGPITNVLLALLLLGLAQVVRFGGLSVAMLAGAAINAFMALFNLIPFGVFDGLKVFRWNKAVWLVLFALAAVTTALTYTQIL